MRLKSAVDGHQRAPVVIDGWRDTFASLVGRVLVYGEIGTAYSELIDPVDQRERLTRQCLLAAAGDPEAMEVDEGFLTALESAMPPTGGLGIGVDRLVMMLTGASIRQTLAVPFVRPDR